MMPKILLLFLIGGVVLPLLTYAFVVITNRGLQWSKGATSGHVGEWAWNLIGYLPVGLALGLSLNPIVTFQTYAENYHGKIAGSLFFVACIIPLVLLIKEAFKINEENIEVKALSEPISYAITFLWTWLAITCYLAFDDISKSFDEFAQLILVFGYWH